jgi:hypothetical protein
MSMEIKSVVRGLRTWAHFVQAPALMAAVLAFLAGCATSPMPTGSRMVVSVPIAQFYKNGPAQDPGFQQGSLGTLLGQDHGPDAQLPKGSSVTLLKRELGFSRVVTDEGAVGYVSNDQMQRAPAITRAVAPSEPAWKPTPSPRRGKPAPSRQPVEKLDLSDIPLPLPS